MTGRKGFFVLYGAPGTRKTTSALQTFQDSLYIASSQNLDQFYNVWLKTPEGIASKKRPPKKVIVLDQYSLNGEPVQFDANGNMILVPQKEKFEELIVGVTRKLAQDKAAGRPPSYPNIIVDEGSVFWHRFFVELKREMTMGRTMTGVLCEKNGDGRAHHFGLQTWTREVIDRFRTVVSMGANLVVICHLTEPEGKRKGGAAMPNKNVSTILAADSHGALLADFEESLDAKTSKHVWRVFASADWNSKMRGISADRFEEIKYWHLEQIIREGDFEP